MSDHFHDPTRSTRAGEYSCDLTRGVTVAAEDAPQDVTRGRGWHESDHLHDPTRSARAEEYNVYLMAGVAAGDALDDPARGRGWDKPVPAIDPESTLASRLPPEAIRPAA
jgi:hypothetical protein